MFSKKNNPRLIFGNLITIAIILLLTNLPGSTNLTHINKSQAASNTEPCVVGSTSPTSGNTGTAATSPGGTNGTSGGTSDALSETIESTSIKRTSCLSYNPDRELVFIDLGETEKRYQDHIQVLKNTSENLNHQYVISGYENQNTFTLSTGTSAFVGPKNNVKRLELAKVLMISHCYPILDATNLKTTFKGNPIIEWSDLKKVHTGDRTNDYMADVAYSGQYWGLWDGFKDNTIKIDQDVTTAESIKMFIRVGELVKDENLTQDSPEGPWYSTFYTKSDDEGTAMSLREPNRANSKLHRDEGLYELLQGIMVRNLYSSGDLYQVIEFLASN